MFDFEKYYIKDEYEEANEGLLSSFINKKKEEKRKKQVESEVSSYMKNRETFKNTFIKKNFSKEYNECLSGKVDSVEVSVEQKLSSKITSDISKLLSKLKSSGELDTSINQYYGDYIKNNHLKIDFISPSKPTIKQEGSKVLYVYPIFKLSANDNITHKLSTYVDIMIAQKMGEMYSDYIDSDLLSIHTNIIDNKTVAIVVSYRTVDIFSDGKII